jgi:hypothetical protein
MASPHSANTAIETIFAAVVDVRNGSWLSENSEIEFANGNFVSTSINLENESAGDGCRDKTIEKTILRALFVRPCRAARWAAGHYALCGSGPNH